MLPPPVGDGVLDVPPSRSPPALPSSASPDRACDDLAVYYAAHGPSPTRRRGRRPRRPCPSSTADPAVSHGLRAAGAARKGGTPGEGSPFDPLLRFFGDGAFRALRRAAKGSAPGPRPLFCKKAGQKTFTWRDFCQPKPLAHGASDEISPRSGHLSGRGAAPTRVGEAGGSRNLTGAPPPQRRFSLGLHPVSLGKTKEMGWNMQHQRKVQQDKTASSTHPQPPALWT